MSRGLTRDMKKTQGTNTRKWKKRDKAVKTKTPTQGCSSEERDEVVGEKNTRVGLHKRMVTQVEGKKTKGIHNDQPCTMVEADVQPRQAK